MPQTSLAGEKCLGNGQTGGITILAAHLQSTQRHWGWRTHTCHGAETPKASQQSFSEPQTAARDLALSKTFRGTDGDMKGRAIKPFPGDSKIISCTFQLPEQQSLARQPLWESLSLLFLGIINRITAVSKALNMEEGGKAIFWAVFELRLWLEASFLHNSWSLPAKATQRCSAGNQGALKQHCLQAASPRTGTDSVREGE